MATVEEKYAWLLSKLEVADLDFWENDGLLRMQPQTFYFQFSGTEIPTVDEAVESAMRAEGQFK